MIIGVGIACLLLGGVIGMLIGAATTYDALTLVRNDSTEHGDYPL
jgi:hypothetical protein